jgi:Ca2+-binding RTX toxin-like protein
MGATVLAVIPAQQAAAGALLCKGKRVTIQGNANANYIIGTRQADVIHALGGKDIVLGWDGIDTICGGRGNDTIDGNKGLDTLVGGVGTRDECIGKPAEHAGNYHFACEIHLLSSGTPPNPPPPDRTAAATRATQAPLGGATDFWNPDTPVCGDGFVNYRSVYVRGAYRNPATVAVQPWVRVKLDGTADAWSWIGAWGTGGQDNGLFVFRDIPTDGTLYQVPIGSQPFREGQYQIGYMIWYLDGDGQSWHPFWTGILPRYGIGGGTYGGLEPDRCYVGPTFGI